MAVGVSLVELMEYTEWERAQWNAWFRARADALAVPTGPHGDGRFTTVGALIRHIFSAECRYVDRLLDRPLTETGTVPADAVEPLFGFGRTSRAGLRDLVQTWPEGEWDEPREFPILQVLVRATARKILVHTLTHEMRHWAQVATLLRVNGLAVGFHDFLGSPVLGGEFRPADPPPAP
jgi:uncharacterized damage-inducible protein DinB